MNMSLNVNVIERIGWTLLHFVWQGFGVAMVLAGVVVLIRLRSPRSRYAASLLAFGLMALAPVATFFQLGGTSGLEREHRAEGDFKAKRAVLVKVTSSLPIGPIDPSIASPSRANQARGPGSRAIAQAEPWPSLALDAWRSWVDRRAAEFAILWSVGVLILSLRLLLDAIAARSLSREVGAVSESVSRRAIELAGRMRMTRLPLVRSSHLAAEALAVGLLRPLILIPVAWLAELPPEMLEAVLAHELAHIRRHDLWVNLVQRIAETLLFYHPAVWWLSRRIRNERELCCDDLAVEATRERIAYASALERVARWRVEKPLNPCLATAMRGGRMSLLERVRNVLGLSHSPSRRGLWPAGLVSLGIPFLVWLAVTTSPRIGNADQPPKDESPQIVFRGVVRDANGKPVPRARVGLSYAGSNIYKSDGSLAETNGDLGATNADAAGAFELIIKRADADRATARDPWSRLRIEATSPGLGCDWLAINDGDDRDHLELRALADDVPIKGRILDLEGKPAPGAKVSIENILEVPDLVQYLKGIREGNVEASRLAGKSHPGPFPGQLDRVATNAKGEFELNGFGKDRLVWLRIDAPGFENKTIQVVARQGPPAMGAKMEFQTHPTPILGSTFEYALLPSRTIEGVVRDKATKEPIGGVLVEAWETRARAVTGVDGKFALNGLPKGPSYRVLTHPNKTAKPYHSAVATIADTAGLGPLATILEVERGVPIRARLVEKTSRAPIHAPVYYVPLHPNPFVHAETRVGMLSVLYPQADGAYLGVGWPGPGAICVESGDPMYLPAKEDPRKHFKHVTGVKQQFGTDETLLVEDGKRASTIGSGFYQGLGFIEPEADSKGIECEIALDRGKSIEVHVKNPAGLAVNKLKVWGLAATRWGARELGSANFVAEGIAESRSRTILIRDDEHQLARVIVVEHIDPSPLIVELAPWGTLTGRLQVDKAHPTDRLLIRADGLSVSGPQKFGRFSLTPVPVDADGRFRIEKLPGDNVMVSLYVSEFLGNGEDVGIGEIAGEIGGRFFNLAPGQSRDLGDLKIQPFGR